MAPHTHPQELSYLTDLAQSVDAEIVDSVGSHKTTLSTQEPMQNYKSDHSEADTFLFTAYSGRVVVDTDATDVIVAAAVITQ